MDKYVILLPLHYNDGSPVSDDVLSEVIDQVYGFADGYTIDGKVKGAYRMKGGQKQEDELLKIWVLIPSTKADSLRALVRHFCHRLGQESIWLEKSNSLIELVEPEESEGDQP